MAAGLTLAAAIAAGVSISAHRKDEYLQAARIAVDPGRVQVDLDLTPGISVAENVLGAIDADRDGTLSPAETQAYAAKVLHDVTLDVDSHPLEPHVIDSIFPSVAAVRGGEGTIRVRLAASLPDLAPGRHRLRYVNVHRADVGVYLANALVPANDRIAITGQTRDTDQRALHVDYELRRGAVHHVTRWSALAFGVAVITLALVRRHQF